MTSYIETKAIHKNKRGIDVQKHPLTAEQVNEIKLHRNNLLSLLKLEELYDQILESFLEFKTQLYANSLKLNQEMLHNHNSAHEVRSKLNRQLFNILNLSKLYFDKHCYKQKSFVLKLTKNDNLHTEIINERNKLFNENKGYALGCLLRNLVQHSTLPINTFTIGIENHFPDENKLQTVRFHLPINKTDLKQSFVKINTSKSKIDSVLEPYDEIIDLHQVIDEYIYGLSKSHIQNRTCTKATIEQSFNELENTNKKFRIQNSSIKLVEKDNTEIELDLTWFSLVEYLQNKNAFCIDYSKQEQSTYNKKLAR